MEIIQHVFSLYKLAVWVLNVYRDSGNYNVKCSFICRKFKHAPILNYFNLLNIVSTDLTMFLIWIMLQFINLSCTAWFLILWTQPCIISLHECNWREDIAFPFSALSLVLWSAWHWIPRISWVPLHFILCNSKTQWNSQKRILEKTVQSFESFKRHKYYNITVNKFHLDHLKSF